MPELNDALPETTRTTMSAVSLSETWADAPAGGDGRTIASRSPGLTAMPETPASPVGVCAGAMGAEPVGAGRTRVAIDRIHPGTGDPGAA
jgi:hypothetical protein